MSQWNKMFLDWMTESRTRFDDFGPGKPIDDDGSGGDHHAAIADFLHYRKSGAPVIIIAYHLQLPVATVRQGLQRLIGEGKVEKVDFEMSSASYGMRKYPGFDLTKWWRDHMAYVEEELEAHIAVEEGEKEVGSE